MALSLHDPVVVQPNAASLFEQACNERMHQFDDADSDEELWEEKEIRFFPESRPR